MNERIKLLAEQAVQAVQHKPNGICDMNKYNQKFAKLIAFECVKLAVFKGDAATGKAIKEHFGLE